MSRLPCSWLYLISLLQLRRDLLRHHALKAFDTSLSQFLATESSSERPTGTEGEVQPVCVSILIITADTHGAMSGS